MSAGVELKIAICDDSAQDLALITETTRQVLQRVKISHSVAVYTRSKELFSAIQSGKRYNLLVLDVMMDELDGMQLATQLREQDEQASIVFVSSNREMALHGYKVSAARYLTKPLNEDDLQEALLYCCRQWQRKKEILLPTVGGQHRISFAEIQYVEAFDRGTRFVLADEAVETRLKFSEVARMLPQTSFVLCHRAYIVNIALTRRIRQYEFTMKSGATVPISRYRYNEVNRQFVEYLTD